MLYFIRNICSVYGRSFGYLENINFNLFLIDMHIHMAQRKGTHTNMQRRGNDVGANIVRMPWHSNNSVPLYLGRLRTGRLQNMPRLMFSHPRCITRVLPSLRLPTPASYPLVSTLANVSHGIVKYELYCLFSSFYLYIPKYPLCLLINTTIFSYYFFLSLISYSYLSIHASTYLRYLLTFFYHWFLIYFL